MPINKNSQYNGFLGTTLVKFHQKNVNQEIWFILAIFCELSRYLQEKNEKSIQNRAWHQEMHNHCNVSHKLLISLYQ